MWFFIKELVFFGIEKFFLNLSRQFARVLSDQKKLSVLKALPGANIGNEQTGQQLLKKINVFGNVILDVKADNPWHILPFSDEVEVGIDGFLWLHDLSIVNNQSARELSQAWIETFPLNRLNKNVQSSFSRLGAILRNYIYLENCIDSEQLKKINNIVKNDYLFLKFYRNFSFDILERLCICHSLVLSGYAFNLSKKKQKKFIRYMIKLFILYKNRLKKGQIRSPEELSNVFFLLFETIEIATKLESGKPSTEEEKLRKISYFFGSSLRYLQFDNGSLVSAHGGSLGDFDRYARLLGEIKNYREGDELSDLGFKRINGARLSMIIDASAPIYGKRDGIAHAGFSSFELYYGTKAIFVNCGSGNRFGHQYRKYCQSSKAHNVLLFNEKSQCSFGKKSFSRRNSIYYIKDGPRNTKIRREYSLTEKILELSHDAYKRDYNICVNRRLSMDLVKNCVMGEDTVFPVDNLKKNLIDASVMLYFHLHPSISFKKRKNGVLLEITGNKKFFFTHKGGNLRLEKSTYTGNFNEPQEITKIVIENSIKHSEGEINWKLEEFID